MRFILIAVFAFVFQACASVSQIETLNSSIAKPVFRSAEPGLSEPNPSGRDYRERLLIKQAPHFTIVWRELSPGVNREEINLLEERVISSHASFGKYVSVDPSRIGDGEVLKANDIDVILELQFSSNKDEIAVNVQYKDPVLSQNFGSAFYSYHQIHDETTIATKNQRKTLEIFQAKNKLVPLVPSVHSYLSEVSAPSNDEIQKILESTVRGKVSVFSSSPGTSIMLDGKEIGKAPLIDYSMLNGKHQLSFSKPGKDPVFRSILIRAGKTSRVFQEWNDDISQGTVLLSSFPTGLDVLVSGQKKGKTQYAESGVPYGSYNVQFVRTRENNNYEYASSEISIRPKSIASLALPIALEEGAGWEAEEFWETSGGSPHFVASFPGQLLFQKKQDLPKGWYGVFSEDIIPDRVESSIKLGLAGELGGRLGIYLTDKEGHSILVVVDKTDFHLVNFAKDEKESLVKSSYRWKSEDVEKGRVFRWETDPEKQLLRVYLGNSLIQEKPWNFKSLWRIAILTPSDSFLSGNPVRGVKIHYPDMVKFEEKIKK
ncbi:LIC10124 family lipoprotein [Leptospira ilyithenensis]|uniref:PEGA domain-containing protein n=1 Tax=Leptospira ilyithenensis TaxID=2484901 RepID=A0A4R9LUR4_9LEPT|nr:PEGA domain-containing protein [Leptospira ilyithenensis]TGN14316.1 PEGA domain-containing protein [Leptospira ilyithenensis]